MKQRGSYRQTTFTEMQLAETRVTNVCITFQNRNTYLLLHNGKW